MNAKFHWHYISVWSIRLVTHTPIKIFPGELIDSVVQVYEGGTFGHMTVKSNLTIFHLLVEENEYHIGTTIICYIISKFYNLIVLL